MPLSDIISKEPIIATPSAQDLANSPEEWKNRFDFHVATYVAMPDIETRWNAILSNLKKKRSATGLIYADTGYGKTSTAVSLWKSAEENEIVAVPPFIWNSLADMLTATHGWVCYRLSETRPDLIPDLEEKRRTVVEIDEKTLIQRMMHEDEIAREQASKAIERLKTEGRLRDVLSPRQLLDYLRFATETLLKADYKGLLILPDEFELFESLDTAQNFNNLKDFIYDIHFEAKLPLGCVTFTYRRTHADIDRRGKHILARFDKPKNSRFDLEQFYGQTEFATHLWEKLATSCGLSHAERNAIDADVLNALGQFLRHSRARELMSGPRSVVSTFNRAARHYTEHERPYSIFDFCEDYLSGYITYANQETESLRAHTQIMELPPINNDESRKLVKLLCVHPEGIPKALFQKHAISDATRERIVQGLLGQHVITKVTGPTLTCYRDDLLGVDKLNEILKLLKDSFNPMDSTAHNNAVSAFREHVLPAILTLKKGREGWSITHEDQGIPWTVDLEGTVLREYPDRTLTVNIGTKREATLLSSDSQFRIQFIFDVTCDTVANSCEVSTNGLRFQFNMQKSINPQEIPAEIGKLGELFLPASITPLLLLSILDFFDQPPTVDIVERENQKTEVNFLKERILNELIGYFFSPQLKAVTVYEGPELATDFASIRAGKNFVEEILRVLIPKQFPNYSALAVSNGWKRYLRTYQAALSKADTSGKKQGIEPIKILNKEIPELLSMGQMAAFRNFHRDAGQNLLRIDEIDSSGNTVREKIEPRNNNTTVAIYFTLHPFEKWLVERLENSSKTISVDGKQVNAMESTHLYQEANKLGYLDEEVEALIDILKARGIVDKQQVRGIEYVYLVDKFINFNELKSKLGGLEKTIDFAKSKGFTYQCENLSSAQALAQKSGIENDEVQKDALRQHLNSAENTLKGKRAEWVKIEYDKLRLKINELQTLCLEVPPLLEQTTGYPLTEFSEILFFSVQPEVKSAYTKISAQIRKIQVEIRDTCNAKIGASQADATPQNAINIAIQLRDYRFRVDTDITELQQGGKNAGELFSLFQEWRTLASQVENDKQLMAHNAKDTEVQNLIERFDDVQRKIRQHLADKRLNLKEVLGNHEHFKVQISGIKVEFNWFLNAKEKAFIAYQANIEKLLAELIAKPHVGVKWNPADRDGCYRETREKGVEKLRDFVDTAQSQLDNVTRALLNPIKIYAVPDPLKANAIHLRQDVEQYAKEFQEIRPKLITENVDQELSSLADWISELVSLREKSGPLYKRWAKIESDMTAFKTHLSPSTQRLHDAVNPLLDDGTFNSPVEIIERLEELYQLRSKP